jgi:hypothetical protein
MNLVFEGDYGSGFFLTTIYTKEIGCFHMGRTVGRASDLKNT